MEKIECKNCNSNCVKNGKTEARSHSTPRPMAALQGQVRNVMQHGSDSEPKRARNRCPNQITYNQITNNFFAKKNVNKDVIALALSGVNTLTLSDYLQSIYQHFGSTVYSSVMASIGSNITIRQELTVDELHIYGSSRHGIYKPKTKLLVNSYRLNDLTTALDSTYATVNYHYFKRTLSLKQYELTNHLGNVLATVLDRKTAVIDSLGSDTLLYYKADVSTAGLYYAFGSAIKEMSYSSDTSNKYRYGFNGEERMDELSGEAMAYDLGARFYDGRLGKMFSIDPLEAMYPWQSPYAYCNNSPVSIVDIKGMGGDPVKHKVQSGETLGALAKKHGTTIDAIKKLNEELIDWSADKRTGDKKDWIYTGEEILIPNNSVSVETTNSSSSTTIDIDGALSELYKKKKSLGCDNTSSSRCSTICEDIGNLVELERWLSLDIGNGQVLLPRNKLLDLWEKREIQTEDGKFYVNADGYIDGRAPTQLVFWPAMFMEGPLLLESFSTLEKVTIAGNLLNVGKFYKFLNGFKDIGHFSNHASSIMKVLGKNSLNFKEYMIMANDVIKTGKYSKTMNGYYKAIPGSTNCYFVGMTSDLMNITTFHIKGLNKIK